MSEFTAEQLAQRAFNLGLLDEVQLQQVWAELGSRTVSLDSLLQALVRHEYLTNFQVERLIKGDRSGYFYGDYKLLYLVGAGTFARVFRAVHRKTGQVVAVKVLRRRFSENPEQYGQFIREGQLGRTLRHPNIVPIYEVASQGNSHYLVMEFVEGRNLREFVKIRGKLDPVEATRLMIDIASGLRYAFERGLTHRDLKMSNVLVASRGQAKLVDFGLAAIDESVHDDGLVELTNARAIDYAALERATGVRKDDTRSDIYFLGCMYYHMLTGQAPLLETKDRVQRLNKTRFLEVIPIEQLEPSLPHYVTAIVQKAMMLDVNRRYQTPAAVLTDLQIGLRRLVEEAKAASDSAARHDRDRLATLLLAPEPQQAVMVVESNTRMQDVFREGLKKAGYRVLLTSDPERALSRFRQEARVADCVVFNAQEIGQSAVAAFNRFAEEEKTRQIPAILLLDAGQQAWREAAHSSACHVVLSMPLTMKQLHAALVKLIPPPSPAEEGQPVGEKKPSAPAP